VSSNIVVKVVGDDFYVLNTETGSLDKSFFAFECRDGLQQVDLSTVTVEIHGKEPIRGDVYRKARFDELMAKYESFDGVWVINADGRCSKICRIMPSYESCEKLLNRIPGLCRIDFLDGTSAWFRHPKKNWVCEGHDTPVLWPENKLIVELPDQIRFERGEETGYKGMGYIATLLNENYDRADGVDRFSISKAPYDEVFTGFYVR
jgi:hypothetical protein